MSTVFVRHQVADYDAWKAGFDDHGRVRRDYGLTDAGSTAVPTIRTT